MKIKNPVSRVFYFQSIGTVDNGTLGQLRKMLVDDQMIMKIGLIAAIVLPLWNVPLIVRMAKRKSSQDISLFWVFGVWFSLLAMLPSGLVSQDVVWKTFNITNFVLFTCVVITACIYRKKDWGRGPK